MNDNSSVIVSLCSFLCLGEGVKPYTTSEWSKLARKLIDNNLTPKTLLDLKKDDFKNILGFDDDEYERINRLISRTASMTFELEKLNRIGIKIITRADTEYPKILKKILGDKCPPLFYYIGNLELLNTMMIGFAGSRKVDEEDLEKTKSLVKECVEHNFTIVDGGAKGVDSAATLEAISLNANVVEFIGDSLLKKMKDQDIINAVRQNHMLILSAVKPDAPFNVGELMSRNKYIYASSVGTIIIKSDHKKGGTWNGALEAIKNNYTDVLVLNNETCKGNIELIKSGCTPLDTKIEFDSLINNFQERIAKSKHVEKIVEKEESYEQLSFCDELDFDYKVKD